MIDLLGDYSSFISSTIPRTQTEGRGTGETGFDYEGFIKKNGGEGSSSSLSSLLSLVTQSQMFHMFIEERREKKRRREEKRRKKEKQNKKDSGRFDSLSSTRYCSLSSLSFSFFVTRTTLHIHHTPPHIIHFLL